MSGGRVDAGSGGGLVAALEGVDDVAGAAESDFAGGGRGQEGCAVGGSYWMAGEEVESFM